MVSTYIDRCAITSSIAGGLPDVSVDLGQAAPLHVLITETYLEIQDLRTFGRMRSV